MQIDKIQIVTLKRIVEEGCKEVMYWRGRVKELEEEEAGEGEGGRRVMMMERAVSSGGGGGVITNTINHRHQQHQHQQQHQNEEEEDHEEERRRLLIEIERLQKSSRQSDRALGKARDELSLLKRDAVCV